MEGRHSYLLPTRTLSPKQLQILTFTAQGFEDVEIAYKLSWSPQTIKREAKTMRRKLEARNRAEAVAIGIRNGLI